jgi:hypothetical protein
MLSSACQALCQVSSFTNRYLLSTYFMPGSVQDARDLGVNKNSIPALLEPISCWRAAR